MRLPTSGSLHMKALIIWLILALSNTVGESSHGSSTYIRRLINYGPHAHGKHRGLGLYLRRLKFSRRGKFKRSTHKSPPINIPTSPSSPSYSSDPYNYSPPYPYNPSTNLPSPPLNTPTNFFAPSASPSDHPNDQISPSTSVSSPWTTNNPPIFTISPSQSPTNSFPPLSPSINILLSPSPSPLGSLPINHPTNSFSPSPSVIPVPNPSNNPASPIMPLSPPFNPPISHLTPSEAPSIAPLPSTTPSHFPPTISPSNPPSNPTILAPPISPSNPPSNPTILAPSISPSNPPSNPTILAPPISPSNPPSNPTILAPSISPSNPPSNPTILAPSISPSSFPHNPPTIPLTPPMSQSSSPLNHSSSLAPTISPSSSPQNSTTTPLSPPVSQSSPPLNPSSTPLAPLISPSNPPISLSAPSISPSNPPISLSPSSVSPSTLPPKPSNSSISPPSPPLNPQSNATSIPPVVSPSPSPSPGLENSINSSKPLGLQVSFYRGLCPNKKVDVEATITARVQQHFQNDPTLLAAILRMQFHDCFVHGCDASILIDGPSSEKNAGPNLSVRGYEFIDTLKEVAETECPGVVSCADIIAIATKELIKLGGGPEYLVQTGRRDGLISDAQDVRLPSPFASVDQSILAFGSKMFTPEEMVVLLGCHTVGISHCAFFQDRLYKGTSQFDPKMDPNLRRQLIPTCPQDTITNNFTSLDQNPQSSNLFDNSFFDQILKQRGILPIDQALARDPKTRGFVLQFARNAALFNTKLVDAMLKLQALEVLTGNQGDIRKVCSRFN